jgi:small multidrug resistance pump
MNAIHICWMYMLLAILLEVVATVFMKYVAGFTKLFPTAMVFICYACTFPLFILALKKIPVSIAYPTWAGIGTLLIFLAGLVFFQESLSTVKIISALLIILGVIGLNL